MNRIQCTSNTDTSSMIFKENNLLIVQKENTANDSKNQYLFECINGDTLKLYQRSNGIDREETIKLVSPSFYISYSTLKYNTNIIGVGFTSAIKINDNNSTK